MAATSPAGTTSSWQRLCLALAQVARDEDCTLIADTSGRAERVHAGTADARTAHQTRHAIAVLADAALDAVRATTITAALGDTAGSVIHAAHSITTITAARLDRARQRSAAPGTTDATTWLAVGDRAATHHDGIVLAVPDLDALDAALAAAGLDVRCDIATVHAHLLVAAEHGRTVRETGAALAVTLLADDATAVPAAVDEIAAATGLHVEDLRVRLSPRGRLAATIACLDAGIACADTTGVGDTANGDADMCALVPLDDDDLVTLVGRAALAPVPATTLERLGPLDAALHPDPGLGLVTLGLAEARALCGLTPTGTEAPGLRPHTPPANP